TPVSLNPSPSINSRTVPVAVCISVESLEKFTSPLTESNLKFHTTSSPPARETKAHLLLAYVDHQKQVIALEEQLRRETQEQAQKLKPADDLGVDCELVPYDLSEYNSRNASNFSLPSPTHSPYPADAIPPLPSSPLSGAFLTTEEVIQKRTRSKIRDFFTKLVLSLKPSSNNESKYKRRSQQHTVHSAVLTPQERHRRHRSLPIFATISPPVSPMTPTSSMPATPRTPTSPTTKRKGARESSISLHQQMQQNPSIKNHRQRLSFGSAISSEHVLNAPILGVREKHNSISSLPLSFIQRKPVQIPRPSSIKDKDFVAYRYPKMVPTSQSDHQNQSTKESTDYFSDSRRPHLSTSPTTTISPSLPAPHYSHQLTTPSFAEPEHEDPTGAELQDQVPPVFPLPAQSRSNRTMPETQRSRAAIISESTRRRYSDSLAGLPVPPFPIGREPPPVTVADSPPVSLMDLGLGIKPKGELSFGIAYGLGADYVAV
ncbi:hypothetical protein BC937DRAFT_94517, partial [Endogone sp. FLAS-F59071]